MENKVFVQETPNGQIVVTIPKAIAVMKGFTAGAVVEWKDAGENLLLCKDKKILTLDTPKKVKDYLRTNKAKAVFQPQPAVYHKGGSVFPEDNIFFRPKLFGKATTKSIIKLLGLKTKKDVKRLNEELKT